MPRVELHICKLTANIDHNLNFRLKVKLVQRMKMEKQEAY